MPTSDDDLRRLFAATFTGATPTDDCPSPEVLFDGFHRLLPPEQTEAILDHLAECPVCADAWRLASRTEPPAPERR